MEITAIESIAPGNPFLSDAYNMGTYLGTNVAVMYDTFPNDKMSYLIVVNTTTGERLKINFAK